MAIGNEESMMDTEFVYGPMDESIVESGRGERHMEKGSSIERMVA
jgi:hypothetical protein